MAVLDPLEIYDMRVAGMSQDQIARKIGVSQTTISKVFERIRLAHELGDTESEWHLPYYDPNALKPISRKGRKPKKGKYL